MERLIQDIIAFRDERNWKQYHNPKDLALSLSLEASELLEIFQWKTSEEAVRTKRTEIEEELADVLIYAITMAHDLEIDVASAIRNKISKNAIKYPAHKAKGSAKKYNEYSSD
ncbi:NTP pyrophosphatase, house-cleaning of non-canonical NTPs [Paenibacillus sp. UNCCL117]|uniref:nucleotide pyrophosphohydrolase n=1 Tax=unclassified Paenibacillus TaxID=185978 RepID=UPI00088CEB17|nr:MULTISPECIES: nucleotide pyrophosphohydrolase [unclassified Paenibacillus]SDE38503.1 NTP pyrophosphatase, house-cleaning of non-canonical NTPs [Paenibacillus sp. cl123]SFW65103.1 NTP pyrophosphatase, house-cleaning of non-canonical NTPs [Paenibacillus sp. UNCCL117]